MFSFPFYRQKAQMDCGVACLKMIATYYGKTITIQKLRKYSEISKEGASLFGISQAAEEIGFNTIATQCTLQQIIEANTFPCILHWEQNHFVVLVKANRRKILIADPAKGLLKVSQEQFNQSWIVNSFNNNGIALMLEPRPKFYQEEEEEQNSKKGFSFLFPYIKPYKKYIYQVFFGLLGASILQLIFPFLTQAIVDKGIAYNDIKFVWLILIAQLVLFISQSVIEYVRSWILMHISNRTNINLVSDFLAHLLKLPHQYFDTQMQGDILQRITDHTRVERFLTQNTIFSLFSFINIIIFSIVLYVYSTSIFLLFLIGTVLYLIWIFIFLKQRKNIDYQFFEWLGKNQSNVIQLINGIHEIKLHNAELNKRWEWEAIQAKLFKLQIKSLKLNQIQEYGSNAIHQIKNILISFVAAKSVIDGNMTLGMMLSVQYIVGQLNAPITQLFNFIKSAQDAKLSLDRITDVFNEETEFNSNHIIDNITDTPKDINIKNLHFKYPSITEEWTLKDINLHIPQGKVTAIVGASGSGKTTLLKLILGYYNINKGKIELNNLNFKNIHPKVWRKDIGVVMQEGYVFSDTIVNNINVDGSETDYNALSNAIEMANIKEYIENLPLGLSTKIGIEGNGLSQGQKQRLLIARAIYKNPSIVLFDEATNALDAENEKIILENLNRFFKGKTVVVVAHRLSTVKNADQIIVLHNGEIKEVGKHEALIKLNGLYFNLIKNQLELGN